jgi:PRA1 family protein
VFFGFGEERPFYIEKNPALLMERIRHNLSFFYLNYMLLTAVLFCLMLLTSPLTIIGLAILAGAWTWVIRSTQSGSLVIGGMKPVFSSFWEKPTNAIALLGLWHSPSPSLLVSGLSIPQKSATIGMAALSAFALMYLLSGVFWWTLFSSGIFCAIHGLLRDASMHKDLDDAVAMQGDLSFGVGSTEESAFLNSNPV